MVHDMQAVLHVSIQFILIQSDSRQVENRDGVPDNIDSIFIFPAIHHQIETNDASSTEQFILGIYFLVNTKDSKLVQYNTKIQRMTSIFRVLRDLLQLRFTQGFVVSCQEGICGLLDSFSVKFSDRNNLQLEPRNLTRDVRFDGGCDDSDVFRGFLGQPLQAINVGVGLGIQELIEPVDCQDHTFISVLSLLENSPKPGVQNGHHAWVYPQEGAHWYRVALGHPHVSCVSDYAERAGAINMHRHRRGPLQRHQPCCRILPQRPRDTRIVLIGEIGGSSEEEAA
eukprot:19691_3